MDIEVPPGEGDRTFLLVSSGGACYALPANQVRHVVRGLACHPVPGSSPHFLGLAQFAGEPLAVLDLHAMAAGAIPQSNHRATVVLGRGERDSWTAVGLAVSDALRVQVLGDSGFEARTDGLVAGEITVDGESVKVVDTALLLEDRRGGEGSGNV